MEKESYHVINITEEKRGEVPRGNLYGKIIDDDLRLLAIQRANAVKSFLVAAGPVEPERLFIIEPEIAAAENTLSRVEMTIK